MPFHHASVKFEHSVCRGSFMTTFIMLLAWLVEHSLVHWYQQCVNVHHVSKYMSCHKAIAVITGKTHCFHDYIYITPSCFCEIWALCHGSLMTSYIILHAWLVEHSCAQVPRLHELPQSHCGNNREGIYVS